MGRMNKKTSFRHPPVVETVIGVQFEPLPKMTNAHLGAFWKTLGPDWPNVTDAPRIEDQFERFDAPRFFGGFQFKLTQNLTARLQIRDSSGDRMIQVQNCRFDYNWLGEKGDEYPRFSQVRPEFDEMFRRYERFIGEAGLGDMKPAQWEITYVNHIPKGTVWESPEDWAGVFRGLPIPSPAPTGLILEGIGGNWHFEIAPKRGRLHVDVKSGMLAQNEREVLVLTLTARGPVSPGADNDAAFDEGLNLGHDTIVRSFVELTSETAHAFWDKP